MSKYEVYDDYENMILRKIVMLSYCEVVIFNRQDKIFCVVPCLNLTWVDVNFSYIHIKYNFPIEAL